MKRILKMNYLIAGLIIVTSACQKNEETGTYWYTSGTYFDSASMANGFIVKLDNDVTLIPNSVSYIQAGVRDSSRVIAMYSIESETDSTIHGKDVQLDGILTKNIIQLTEANNDSIGNDEVQINDDNIWLTENHLNIIFSYYGGGTAHMINLAKPIGEQLDENGRQILEFRHNMKNDPVMNYFTSIVSFDMRSLYTPGMDSINFVLLSKDLYNGTYSWDGTYYFKNQGSTKSTSKALLKISSLVK